MGSFYYPMGRFLEVQEPLPKKVLAKKGGEEKTFHGKVFSSPQSTTHYHSSNLKPAVSVTGREKVRGWVPCSLVYPAIAFMISLFFSLRDTI